MKLKINIYKWILAFILLAVAVGSFYWFSYRPTEIKKKCSTVTAYTEAKKEVTQVEVDEANAKYDICNAYLDAYKDTYELQFKECLENKRNSYLNTYSYDLADEKARQSCHTIIDSKVEQKYRDYVGITTGFMVKDCAFLKSTLHVQAEEPSKEYQRNDTEAEYKSCIRQNGL